MKLVFICGSLEVSKDGVGDYVRRLAAELIRQGHDAGIVALNDKYVTELWCGLQESEGTHLKVLRVPAIMSRTALVNDTKQWINTFNPEWISLQFVPFAFHPKGLITGLGALLINVCGERKFHIMFHELWVGMDTKASKKLILWGWVQRQLIKSMIRTLKPIIIHTQTHLYVAQLQHWGFNAKYFPLFGNIPVNDGLAKTMHYKNYASNNIVFVHFGTVYPNAPVNRFVQNAASYAKANDVNITIKLIGHCGSEKEKWQKACETANIPIVIPGPQSASLISAQLSAADIGLTTTAFPLVEKSGSVAAMREHGLPVVCVAHKWVVRNNIRVSPQNEIAEYGVGNFEDCIAKKPNPLFVMNVSIAGRQLIHTLMNMATKK